VKTAGKVQDALGGVLFIDEAYALKHEGSEDSFGQEAVDMLVSEMENHRKRLVIVPS
jgi:stage V sporulation protein K